MAAHINKMGIVICLYLSRILYLSRTSHKIRVCGSFLKSGPKWTVEKDEKEGSLTVWTNTVECFGPSTLERNT